MSEGFRDGRRAHGCKRFRLPGIERVALPSQFFLLASTPLRQCFADHLAATHRKLPGSLIGIIDQLLWQGEGDLLPFDSRYCHIKVLTMVMPNCTSRLYHHVVILPMGDRVRGIEPLLARKIALSLLSAYAAVRARPRDLHRRRSSDLSWLHDSGRFL